LTNFVIVGREEEEEKPIFESESNEIESPNTDEAP